MSKKELVVGENYGACFGLKKEGQALIYMGGNKWKAVCPVKGENTADSEKMTASALNYINSSVKMGAKA